MALLSKFFGRTVSSGAAYSFGLATGPVLAPATEKVRQEAWTTYADRIPGVASLAAGVAQGQVEENQARTWAKAQGFDKGPFNALIDIANVGPDVAMAMRAWRRDKLTTAQFRLVLRRHAIEEQWNAAIEALKAEVLDPAELARAIHRGLIPDPGLLKGRLPSGTGNVPAYPVYGVDALTEAQASGYDHDRLGVLVGLQGLPMGSHEAAQALFRGVLTEDDYLRAIAEGNTRNEWADAIMEQSRQIPSSGNYVAAFIRGWIDRAKMHAGAHRHGMTPEDADLLALVAGRPVTTRQAFIGFIRGGRVAGQTWDERETFRRAVLQSNIRPEWEPVLWAQRYSYPSAFVLRALTQNGDISVTEAEQVLLYSGWEPTFAHKVSQAWATGGAATSKGLTVTDLTAEYEALTMSRTQYVNGLKELGYSQAAADGKVSVSDAKRQRLARNQLINRARVRYTTWKITKQAASDALRAAALTIGNANDLLTYWDAERDLNVHTLTEPQVVKAWKKQIMDRPTAVERLSELGLAQADIDTRLDES